MTEPPAEPPEHRDLSTDTEEPTMLLSRMAESVYWAGRYLERAECTARIVQVHTDTPSSPWYVVESDVKKHSRLNMMAHLLSTIEYHEVQRPRVELPKRPVVVSNYQRPPRELSTYVDDHVATLIGDTE